MDFVEYNRAAWNRNVELDAVGPSPLRPVEVPGAGDGEWRVWLTPTRPVPRGWFGELRSKRVLCLGSAGGEQVPVLAATGARVTSLDASERQLERDEQACTAHHLEVATECGNMQDLSRFADGSFDLVFNAASCCYVPDVKPVWRECARVLAPGGALLAGFYNPLFFLFEANTGSEVKGLHVAHELPYAVYDELSPAERAEWREQGRFLHWGHTLDDLIGAQLAAGFAMTDFYEDRREDERAPAIDRYASTFIATLAVKVRDVNTES